jgi:Ca-activated chloride channel homolog
MTKTVLVWSRSLRGIAPIASVLFFCGSQSLLAQTASGQTAAPASTQAPAPTSPAAVDYTRPEIQPSQDIDRDPVPSPDVTDKGPLDSSKAIGAKQDSGSTIYTLHENVDEVLLTCTVIDEHGRLVDNLVQGAFRIWEDDTPQTIASFSHQDVPVSIGILVDNSGSMRDKRSAVNEAALDLVRHSNRSDAAFVVNFSEKAYLDQGFTSNISELEKGLSHYDARGTTAMYDAVVAAADELTRHAKGAKQVLLIITDGADNASRLSLEQAVRRVQQLGGPTVFTIGLLYDADSKQEAERAKDDLQKLSNETGGVAYFPASLSEVDDIANEVARVIRNQYTLGYHSTKAANLGGYRTVRVEALSGNKHEKLTVKTRNGYYPREIKQMHAVQTAQAGQKSGTKP